MNGAHFNFKRFLLVARQDWQLNRKPYLLIFAALFAVQMLFYTVFNSSGIGDTDSHYTIFFLLDIKAGRFHMGKAQYHSMFIFFLFAVFQSCNLRRRMAHKRECLRELTLPASSFEKFAWQWILAVPCTALACFLTFIVAEHVKQFIFHAASCTPDGYVAPLRQLSDFSFYRIDGYVPNMFTVYILLIFFAQALGMALRRRAHRMVQVIGVVVTVYLVAAATFPSDMLPLAGIDYQGADTFESAAGTVIWYAGILTLILVLWCIAYRNYVHEELIFTPNEPK